MKKMLSIVVPAYNEQENVKPLYTQLKKVSNHLRARHEIIFIDDGSTDRTFKNLKEIASRDRSLKIISFKRNFGQSAAISAGFRHAKGDVIITLDADLQNNPADIPKLLNKLKKGNDLVCGWRKKRHDHLFRKRIPSHISNWLASKITGVKIHDFGCTLRAYKRQVIKDLEVYGEMHRYIPALAKIEGYSVAEVEVSHQRRKKGKTKYGRWRIFKGMSDLITLTFVKKFGARPGHIFSSLGLSIFGLGFLLLGFLIGYDIYDPSFNLPNRTLLFISIMMVLSGVQFITIGILSEMITRVRYEVEHKKFYKIKKIINQ